VRRVLVRDPAPDPVFAGQRRAMRLAVLSVLRLAP
jgi:hypothetical protein